MGKQGDNMSDSMNTMGMMPAMMLEMMPVRLKGMLPRVPGKERIDFMIRMLGQMMAHGTAHLSEAEFAELVANLREILDKATPPEADTEGETGKIVSDPPKPGG